MIVLLITKIRMTLLKAGLWSTAWIMGWPFEMHFHVLLLLLHPSRQNTSISLLLAECRVNWGCPCTVCCLVRPGKMTLLWVPARDYFTNGRWSLGSSGRTRNWTRRELRDVAEMIHWVMRRRWMVMIGWRGGVVVEGGLGRVRTDQPRAFYHGWSCLWVWLLHRLWLLLFWTNHDHLSVL